MLYLISFLLFVSILLHFLKIRKINTSKQELEQITKQISEDLKLSINAIKGLSQTLMSNTSKISRDSNHAENAIDQGLSDSEETESVLLSLYQNSNEIRNLLEIISDISIQTRVLALNANIEAEKAGEAGKGFAIVASEVDELAKQSRGSLELIEESLSNIQVKLGEALGSITKTTNSMRSVDRISASINKSVENQNESNTKIDKNIHKLISHHQQLEEKVQSLKQSLK